MHVVLYGVIERLQCRDAKVLRTEFLTVLTDIDQIPRRGIYQSYDGVKDMRFHSSFLLFIGDSEINLSVICGRKICLAGLRAKSFTHDVAFYYVITPGEITSTRSLAATRALSCRSHRARRRLERTPAQLGDDPYRQITAGVDDRVEHQHRREPAERAQIAERICAYQGEQAEARQRPERTARHKPRLQCPRED